MSVLTLETDNDGEPCSVTRGAYLAVAMRYLVDMPDNY